MEIQYTLMKNHLTEDPDDYAARVRTRGTADMEYLIKRIIKQGSTVVKSDILSVLEDYHDVIETLLQEGFSVLTPTANYRPGIKGSFRGADDGFDPSRHRVLPRVSAGARLRRALSNGISVVQVDVDKPLPILKTFIDTASGTRNHIVTPGNQGKLIGRRLQFEAEDPEQGIFFLAVDGSATRVEWVTENLSSRLIFLIPVLSPGQYQLEVRAALSNGKIRSGVLDDPLTVA